MNILRLTTILLLLTACTRPAAQGTGKALPAADTITTFVMPTIPPMLDTPQLRADYLVKHYWEHTNLSDTNYVHHPEVTEQAWVNFIDLLRLVEAAEAAQALQALMKQAEASRTCFDYFARLADIYLYDPNSPMRNEELYIAVLDAELQSSLLSATEKIRPQARRTLAEKNRCGTRAIDFTYTLKDGRQETLHKLQADYILLFFNNPGCHSCVETTEALKQSEIIGKLERKGALKILAFYPDEEIDEWCSHTHDFPATWINGYDASQSVNRRGDYDLKAIPTLYLLDKNKTVLLKDVRVDEIESWITRYNVIG